MRAAVAALAMLGCASARPAVGPAPAPYSDADGSLELHAHLFMGEGMGLAFHGDFFGPLAGTDWTARWDSVVNVETLERSGIGIVVLCLYAHPLFSSPRSAIHAQLDLADRFVAEHPDWIIARSAGEARAALASGKRVIVLALEGAHGTLESDSDIADLIDRRGIRIVTFLHMIDDPYGGVAFLPGARALFNPLALLDQAGDPVTADGVRVNPRGLTERGRLMAHKLMEHGVWLDIAHASDESSRELIAMAEQAHLPVLNTHTVTRRHLDAERGATDWELAAIARTGGVVGIVPSEEMLAGTPMPPGTCSSDCKLPCVGGIQALAQEYRAISAIVPSEDIGLGSDYGAVTHLRPSCPIGTGIDAEGLWNIGQAGVVWQSLDKLGAPVPHPLRKTLDHFLDAWSRVTPRHATVPKDLEATP